ncbi:MAG: copper chaperone PCu(A)C [Parvibaculum sp.]|uniref:copper chaperone PCu(A)C n=1 Tax=Parvibaculum sp. TaxID=2024848 RepID=UPI00391A4DD1
MLRRTLFSLLLAAPLLAACGESSGESGALEVRDAWARASATQTSAAYLVIENKTGEADTLLEARSPVAERVEIHDMTMEDMVMRMRRLDALPVGAGESVELAPGGTHIMLIGLFAPLEEGASVPLTLVFEKAGEIETEAPVRAAGSAGHGGH